MIYPIIEGLENVEITEEIEELINKVCQQVAKTEKINDEYEVNIILVDDPFIQNLNSKFRGKDKPTDVLSFPFDIPEFLGEIYISLETAKRQGEEYNHSLEREIAFLTVHGLLHLLGYDHDDNEPNQIMRQKEEEILTGLGISRG